MCRHPDTIQALTSFVLLFLSGKGVFIFFKRQWKQHDKGPSCCDHHQSWNNCKGLLKQTSQTSYCYWDIPLQFVHLLFRSYLLVHLMVRRHQRHAWLCLYSVECIDQLPKQRRLSDLSRTATVLFHHKPPPCCLTETEIYTVTAVNGVVEMH